MKPLIVATTLLIETSPQALPLGAACIASAIKHDSLTKDKFEVKLIPVSKEEEGYLNAPQDQKTDYIVKKILSAGVPKYILFSVYVWNHKELEEVSRKVKILYPEILTLAGGPEVTANPTAFEGFDYTVSGAGEVANPQLISLLEEGKLDSSKLVQGVFSPNLKIPETEGIKNSLCRAMSPDLLAISSPYLDGTLDVAEYGGALWELARGCPFKCSYCYESKGEKKIQYFPMERIEKELELFNQKKISQVFVLDPTYNANKKRAADLLNLIAKKAPGMFFYFEARAEFIDRELAKAFTKIPCALQFGLQSADPEVLKLVNRTLDKKLFSRNIGYLNETGAIFGFDLIFGLPGDTLEGFKKSIDFALNLYPNNLETFCLSVLPGTDLYEKAAELKLTWEPFPPYHVIKTDKYSEKDMAQAQKLSHACNIFYNQGRAVPWFNTVCKSLKMRPSIFLEEFAKWCQQTNKDLAKTDFACLNHLEIEKNQMDFVRFIFNQRQKTQYVQLVQDIVRLNGALSRVESDGKEQIVKLSYHPDDLMSQYAQDFSFFLKNAGKYNCTVSCFKNNNGIDWKVKK